MEMCYDGALIMPSSYAVMDEEEMTYVEGGITVAAVCQIITVAIAVGGASYASGAECGKRLYYAGVNTSEKWSKCKWSARICVLARTPILGSMFMLGLENKLYSMM